MTCKPTGTDASQNENENENADFESQKLFDKGFYCAEGVLMSIAKEHGIESPIIPAIATGFCSGMARTSGMCGALTGGMLALNLVLGRQSEKQSVEHNYRAVQSLVTEFKNRCGSVNCSELLDCDLGTPEGQVQFGKEELWRRCREYVGVATEIAESLIERNNDKDKT